MKIIQPWASGVGKMLNAMKIKPTEGYRPSRYTVSLTVSEGELLYNSLTGEMILLEQEALPEDYLISHRFWVETDSDDRKLCDEIRNILYTYAELKTQWISSYTILTTTDCNARCFYCYETGCEKLTMDQKTAHDIADYIMAHAPKNGAFVPSFDNNGGSDPHEVEDQDGGIHLSWFGGEPLYNDAAIDVICYDLREKGCAYKSSMITNGYLFDEKTVAKAAELWHLKKVQITLDGTSEIYRRRKAYIYNDPDPLKRVMKNIHLLIDAGMRVSIRLNVDQANYEDLKALADQINGAFSEKEKTSLRVYSHYIFQDERETNPVKRQRVLAQNNALNDVLIHCGLQEKPALPKGLRINGCMSDSAESLAILPDGRLHSCQHFVDNEIWGSIYTGETKKSPCHSKGVDGEAKITPLSYWREQEYYPQCETCFFYPQCLRLKHCPDRRMRCDPDAVEERKVRLKEQMRECYEQWKTDKVSS